MPQKYLHVDGVATFLHHTGPTTLPDEPPDTRRGKPVLCLHGSGGNGHAFAPLLEALAPHHSPLAFDQPGHGRSGGLDSLGSVGAMAAFTGKLAAALGLRGPVLLGHSLGGAVALELALASPDAAGALVLAASAAGFASLPSDVLEQVRRVSEGKERRRFDRGAWSPKAPDDVLRRGFLEDLKTDPRALLGDLLAARAWDASDRLGDVALPALVLVGADEAPAMRAKSEELAAGIPGAQLVEIPDAGHMLHFERPEAVAAAVEGFLAGAVS